jgi:mono/diheme cytochrome c family protein
MLAAALAAAAAGCDEKLSDVAGPTPDLTPTFASIQREIFNTTDASGRVACIQCHTDNGRAPAGNLVLLEGRSYNQLVLRASSFKPGAVLVRPNDPDGSYFVHKLTGQSDIVGQRMPRTGGPFLSDGQISIIRRWIEQGAQND